MDDNQNDENADPGDYTAHNPWMGSAENPAQLFARVPPENTQRLQAENPSRMEPDREIEGTRAQESVAQRGTNQE
jgi:hypothetical protein